MQLTDKQAIKVSKTLSLGLRHHPEALGVSLDAQGWTETRAVLAGLSERGYPISQGQLREIVETNDKQRFALSPDGRRIRANQGHSIDVDLALEPAKPPAVLWHGSDQRNVGLILRDGLLKMKRQHVHLSADQDTAYRVGARRRGEVALFKVDAAAMWTDGVVFYRSANGVWLIDYVPVAYLSYEFTAT